MDRIGEVLFVPAHGGIGDDCVNEGGAEAAPEAEKELEGVSLSVEMPLKELKELCEKLGIPKSGEKPKVLQRLRNHRELLERQLAGDVARALFREQERRPEGLKAPILPTKEQQDLHAITHQPFQPWCQACVLGRSRQSPHKAVSLEAREEEVKKDAKELRPVIQIDYCYTFTKKRGEQQLEEVEQGDEDQKMAKDELDYRDQYGLNCWQPSRQQVGYSAYLCWRKVLPR